MRRPTRRVRVVAALITSDDGRRVLVQKRPEGKPRELLWEFPGGKVEAGESDQAALRREAREELGVELEVGVERYHVLYPYPDLEVDLHVYRAKLVGTARLQCTQELRETPVTELPQLHFCAADLPLVEALVAEASEGDGRLAE